jgi:Mg-chelatase subunit ChlD
MDLVAVDAAELDRAAVDEEARPGHLDLAEADAADDLLERAGGRAKLAWPFSGQARTAVGLTNDEGDIISAIRTVRAGDGARMDLGIRKATDILRNSRYGEPWMAGGIEVMIIFADGLSDNGCAAAVAEARKAKGKASW